MGECYYTDIHTCTCMFTAHAHTHTAKHQSKLGTRTLIVRAYNGSSGLGALIKVFLKVCVCLGGARKVGMCVGVAKRVCVCVGGTRRMGVCVGEEPGEWAYV